VGESDEGFFFFWTGWNQAIRSLMAAKGERVKIIPPECLKNA
jgi:hypothetical protein